MFHFFLTYEFKMLEKCNDRPTFKYETKPPVGGGKSLS